MLDHNNEAEPNDEDEENQVVIDENINDGGLNGGGGGGGGGSSGGGGVGVASIVRVAVNGQGNIEQLQLFNTINLKFNVF